MEESLLSQASLTAGQLTRFYSRKPKDEILLVMEEILQTMLVPFQKFKDTAMVQVIIAYYV